MTTERHDTTDEEKRSEERSEHSAAEQRDGTSPLQGLGSFGVPKWAGTLLLVALLLPFLLFAVPQVVGADHGFVILSGSMEPALSPGDVVIVSDSASVQVGDVITFDGGDTVPITHRIIGVEDGQYITKGDANENVDGAAVPPVNVLGRVVLTIPVVGYVVLWANTPVGQILLVVVPLVALGVSSLYRWANDEPGAGRAVDSEEVTEAEHAADATQVVDTEHVTDLPHAAITDDRQSSDSDATAALDAGLDALADAIGTADTTIEPPAIEAEDGTVAVTAPDLTLTLVSTAALTGYAAWNVVDEIGSAGAPEPVSVAVLTAGLLGVGFALWATVAARRARTVETGTAAEEPPEPTAADGGVDVEEDQ